MGSRKVSGRIINCRTKSVLTGGVSAEYLTPENYANARNLGGEAEFRKSLGMFAPQLGEWILWFSLISNVTLLLIGCGSDQGTRHSH